MDMQGCAVIPVDDLEALRLASRRLAALEKAAGWVAGSGQAIHVSATGIWLIRSLAKDDTRFGSLTALADWLISQAERKPNV
jgi:hypothetical protein